MTEASVDFVIRIESYGCCTEIRLNDCPIHEERNGHPGGGEMPCDQWVHLGTNSLALTLTPIPGAVFDTDTTCNVTVIRRIPGVGETELAQCLYRYASDSIDRAPEDAVGLTSEFRLPTGPNWMWQKSPRLQSPKLRQELEELYQLYHGSLSAADYTGLLRLVAKRDEELAVARRISFSQQQEDSRREFEGLIAAPDWTLAPLATEKCTVQLFANGKLARFVDRFGKSPLYFEREDLAAYVRLLAARSEEGQLIVCR